jgi:hypothetical protein
MYPLNMPLDATDLFDPDYADLYGPPQKPILQSGMGPKALAVPATGGATEAIINESAEEGVILKAKHSLMDGNCVSMR